MLLAQLVSPGRSANSELKGRTFVDTLHGGEGRAWRVLWQLLQTLMAVCFYTLSCFRTHTHKHTHSRAPLLFQPPVNIYRTTSTAIPALPLTFSVYPLIIYFPAKILSCSSGVPRGSLLWRDSDKMGDATEAANQKLDIHWKPLTGCGQINERPGEV